MFWDTLILCILGAFVVLIYKCFTFPHVLEIFSEGLRSTISYFIFYFAGVLVGKYKWLDVFFTNKKIFSALLPLFIVLLSQFTYDMSSIFNQAMKVVLACLAISCMGYIVTHITWNKRIDDVVSSEFRSESLSITVTDHWPLLYAFPKRCPTAFRCK